MQQQLSVAAQLAETLADVAGARRRVRRSYRRRVSGMAGWSWLAAVREEQDRVGWIHEIVQAKGAGRIALVAPTVADARDTVIEGESGILATAPSWCRPEYEPSKRKLTWPNGAIAHTFSSEESDRLRGPQFDFAFADELPLGMIRRLHGTC